MHKKDPAFRKMRPSGRYNSTFQSIDRWGSAPLLQTRLFLFSPINIPLEGFNIYGKPDLVRVVYDHTGPESVRLSHSKPSLK